MTTWDMAMNRDTGDWIFMANTDLAGIEGEEVTHQRIVSRLRMAQGWELDPTHGTLGSRLRTGLRIQRGRLIRELPLMAKEALAPMTDIEVVNVWVEESTTDSRQLILHIDYLPRGIEIDPDVEMTPGSLALELET
jgi:hypothetical protein